MIRVTKGSSAPLEFWLGMVCIVFGVGISLPPNSFGPGLKLDGILTIPEFAVGFAAILFGVATISGALTGRLILRKACALAGLGIWMFIGTSALLQLSSPTSGMMAITFATAFGFIRTRL